MKTIKKREDSKVIRMLYSRSNQTEQHGCSASFLSQKFKHKNWLEKIGLKFRDEKTRRFKGGRNWVIHLVNRIQGKKSNRIFVTWLSKIGFKKSKFQLEILKWRAGRLEKLETGRYHLCQSSQSWKALKNWKQMENAIQGSNLTDVMHHVWWVLMHRLSKAYSYGIYLYS